MTTYHTATFVSVTQYYLTLGTTISGSVVGQTGSQLSDDWYDSGTSSTISATTPYTNGTTNRFLFQKWTWSLGGTSQTDSTDNPYIITIGNYVSATAKWTASGDTSLNGQFSWWSLGLVAAIIILIIIFAIQAYRKMKSGHH
jgi:outer membrane protein assembly factor BamA